MIIDVSQCKNLPFLVEVFLKWNREKKTGEIRVVMQDGGLRNIIREHEKEVLQPVK